MILGMKNTAHVLRTAKDGYLIVASPFVAAGW